MGHLDREGGDVGPGQDEREDEVVPGEHEGEDGGREQAGAGHGEDHLPQDGKARAAIDQGALFQLQRDVLDVAAHHPDHVGQVEGGIEHDQAQEGVDPAEPDVEEEDREHDHDRRRHALADDPDREIVAAGPEAGDRIGGHGAEQHGERGAGAGDHQAVPDRDRVAVLEQHGIVGELQAGRIPGRRRGEDLGRGLERDHDQPVDREHEERGDQHGAQIAPGEADAFPPLPGRRRGGHGAHRAISIRLSAATTRIERSTMIRTAIAAV